MGAPVPKRRKAAKCSRKLKAVQGFPRCSRRSPPCRLCFPRCSLRSPSHALRSPRCSQRFPPCRLRSPRCSLRFAVRLQRSLRCVLRCADCREECAGGRGESLLGDEIQGRRLLRVEGKDAIVARLYERFNDNGPSRNETAELRL